MTSATMEDWLTQLEMEINSIPCYQYHESETMVAPPDEQFTATLGDDFPYPLYASSGAGSPEEDIDCSIFIEQFLSTPQIPSNDGDNFLSSNVQESPPSKNKKEEIKKQEVSGGAKRKRQPSQVQDHIIAERRRREILSQMFISLSALVPGLKKVDKTSVLGEAIKHMKQLKERVKELEEVVAKRTVQSVVTVQNSKLLVDDVDGGIDDNVSSLTVNDNSARGNSGSGSGSGSSSSSDGDGDGDGCGGGLLPEIEVKISGRSLLLRVYCGKHNENITKLLAEVDKHGMAITNLSVVPFENIALDITIVAQTGRGFNKDAKIFVRTLRSILC